MIISYPALAEGLGPSRDNHIYFFISYLVLCTQFSAISALCTTTPAIPRRSIIM